MRIRSLLFTPLLKILQQLLICALAALLPITAAAATKGSRRPPPNFITGVLEIVHGDDFENGRSENFFFVREQASGRTFELKFDWSPGQLISGQRVSVRGQPRNGALQVDEITVGCVAVGRPRVPEVDQ